MSEPGGHPGHWAQHGAGRDAASQLATTIAGLSRARWRQLLVEQTAAGLSVALLGATAVVLCIRLGILPWDPGSAVALLVLAGVAVSAAVAWRRRPDTLEVAIVADVKLNLKQRMSTAWEFTRLRGDDDLTRRLAQQAVRARLPSRSASVFPPRVNALGLLAPVAAIALVLVSIVDLEPATRRGAPLVDESVVSEGVRLRAYGQRMEARARRDALPRSTEQSRRLQHMGSRLQAGGLTRPQALTRLEQLGRELDEQIRASLDAGEHTDVGPLDLKSLDGDAGAPSAAGARALLERLLDGNLDPGDMDSLADDRTALSRLGITDAELESALEQFRQGEAQPLRKLLERLSRAEQASEDARELRGARRQVDRARESLGDPGARQRTSAQSMPGVMRDGHSASGGPALAPEEDGTGEAGAGGSTPGGPGSRRARGQRQRPARASDDGPVLEAEAKVRAEGNTFVSQGRALPRAGVTAAAPTPVLDARFEQQMEAVLSNEHIPSHHKDYVRRYFLRLSEGTRREEPQQ